MSKNKVQIRFPNLYLLWNFVQYIHATSVEINTAHKTLSCSCSEAEISLALQKFNAELLQVSSTDVQINQN
jgi:hypothetical protein